MNFYGALLDDFFWPTFLLIRFVRRLCSTAIDEDLGERGKQIAECPFVFLRDGKAATRCVEAGLVIIRSILCFVFDSQRATRKHFSRIPLCERHYPRLTYQVIRRRIAVLICSAYGPMFEISQDRDMGLWTSHCFPRASGKAFSEPAQLFPLFLDEAHHAIVMLTLVHSGVVMLEHV